MKNLNLYAIFLCITFNIYSENLKNERRNSHTLFKKMMEVQQEFMESIRDDFFEDIDVQSTRSNLNVELKKSDIQIKENADNVELLISIPDSKIKGNIELKGKGKNLEGSFTYNDHKVNFNIIKGRIFRYWVTFKEEKKKEKDRSHFSSTISSFSSRQITLPKEVINLEDTKAYFVKEQTKDKRETTGMYKLKIVLPSIKLQEKSDLQKITIKDLPIEVSTSSAIK